MKATLPNGTVIEGTLTELVAAGILTQGAAATSVQAVTNPAVVSPKVPTTPRPGTKRERYLTALHRAAKGKAAQLPITASGEVAARSELYKLANIFFPQKKLSTNKTRNGHRWALNVTLA